MDIYHLCRFDNYIIEPDYIPISYLDAFCFCPRLFWYNYVFKIGRMNDSFDKWKGIPDSVFKAYYNKNEFKQYKYVRIFSPRLRIVGYTDLVEDKEGKFSVVEYVKDETEYYRCHVLLCAKVLCLEDTIGKGQVSSFADILQNQDRHRFEITADLKVETETVILDAFSLLTDNSPPGYAKNKALCQGCSLRHVCFS